MLAFLRDANTSKSVIDVYEELYYKLGGQDFRKLFPIILTDNGSEFSNPRVLSMVQMETEFEEPESIIAIQEHPIKKQK